MSYQRAQEEQADRAGVKFLAATGQSAKGMYDTFKRLSDEILFRRPRRRSLSAIASDAGGTRRRARGAGEGSPNWDKKDSAELQERHDMMRAKLAGFLDRGDTVARRYPMSDNSLPARYARAIATYRHAGIRAALGQIDGLIQAQPNNPYFHELKGQALLEGGKAAEAIAPLRRAVQLAPHPRSDPDPAGPGAERHQRLPFRRRGRRAAATALAREPELVDGYTQLAMAYGRKGDLAQADLASALAAFMRGDATTARQLAARAKTRFPIGSPGWVKADDIVSSKQTMRQ